MKKKLITLLCLALLSTPVWAFNIQIEDPFVSPVPPGSPVAAGYMKIHNAGAEDRKIVDASSSVSEYMELHTHTEVDGVMQMRKIPFITVPAGGTTELVPGGLHLMFIDLRQSIPAGSQVDVQLTFDDGSLIELDMPVRRLRNR